VVDIIDELRSFGVDVLVADPLVDPAEAMHEYGLELTSMEKLPKVDAVVLATAHNAFRKLDAAAIKAFHSDGRKPIFVDVKRVFNRREFEKAGITYWGL